jgi:hypothetical protein
MKTSSVTSCHFKTTRPANEFDLSLVSIAATFNTALQWADQLVGTGSHEPEKR